MNRTEAIVPFRPFFLLAALDAILGATAWMPASLLPSLASSFATAGTWHRNVLLFGMVPAMLAGFLLTALPRWTRRPPIKPVLVWSLAALWLCARGAFLFVSTQLGLALACLFILTLTLVTSSAVLAAGDSRNVKVVVLLLVFCGGALLTTASIRIEEAQRMTIATIVGLLMIIAGRVIPTLTMAFGERERKRPFIIQPSRAVEQAAATAALCGLCAWAVSPGAKLTAYACTVAACAQAARMAQWRGWQVRALPVMALHAGYGWIVAGFVLVASHVLASAWIDRLAAIHVWMVGATGTLALAIMTSMMRRHSRRPFARLSSATAASVSVTVSCLSRLVASLPGSNLSFWTALSGASWIAAFCLFLISFRQLSR